VLTVANSFGHKISCANNKTDWVNWTRLAGIQKVDPKLAPPGTFQLKISRELKQPPERNN
jgi:hypothetical protein